MSSRFTFWVRGCNGFVLLLLLQMVVRGFENCREPCILVRQDGKYLSNYIEAVQSMVDGTSLVTAMCVPGIHLAFTVRRFGADNYGAGFHLSRLDEAELGVLWVEVAYCAGGVFAMTEAFPSLITDVEGVVHDLHQFACSRIQMTKAQAIALVRVRS